jgi:hypothetical protein
MEKSESIKELATALSAAQGEMPAVPMGSTNPFLKNKYANLGDVIKTVQPVLAAHGLAVSQAVYCDGPVIGVETILMHSSGEWLSSKMGTVPGDDKGISQVQAAGKVITYLRRYTLSSVLGVYADEDADGNENKPAPVKTSQQPAQPQAEPKPAPGQSVITEAGSYVGNVDPALLVKLGLSENVPAAGQLLTKLKLAGHKAAEALPIIRKYRAARDAGKTTDEAAAIALA